jgi:hypothetical protein
LPIPISHLFIKTHSIIAFVFIIAGMTPPFPHLGDGTRVNLFHLPNFIGIAGVRGLNLRIGSTY